MSKAVQRRRGTTAEHLNFIGLQGEWTQDTTKNTIRVHDGVTAGGFPLAREDGNIATADKLSSSRKINISGDLTGKTSFDGSADVNIVSYLSTTGVVAGTYNTVKVDEKGRVLVGSNVADTITKVNGKIGDVVLTSDDLSDSATKRFVTDAQISAWDAKQTSLGFTAENVENKNVASGYAGLDANGKLNKSQLPDEASNTNIKVGTTELSGSSIELVAGNNITLTPGTNSIKIDAASGSQFPGVYRYEADGSTNGDCIVTASAKGVSYVKTGNSVALTVPNGVVLISLRVHFTGAEVGSTGTVIIDYDSTNITTDYTKIYPPNIELINDNSSAYAHRASYTASYNVSPHTSTIGGLAANIPIWVKMTF